MANRQLKKLILGIETSCDETGLALVEATGSLRRTPPQFTIIKNLIASQIPIHAPFGGVVPNLAKREHLKNLPILWEQIRTSPTLRKRTIDMIAVTVGPGLEPALWTGITFAQQLHKQLRAENPKSNIALVGANHLEGHLYSFLLPQKNKKSTRSPSSVLRTSLFPAIALIVSGGHTTLLRVASFSSWKRIGETRDDAVGEAFDKVARILDLPYPGGPEIQKLAAHGNGDAITFPQPMRDHKNYDFSFSGLKTSVLYYVRDNPSALRDAHRKADIAASFEKAATDVLVHKTLRAAQAYGVRTILLSGGVAANQSLRNKLSDGAKNLGITFSVADQEYNTDNAVMIAAAGYFAHLRKKKFKLAANGGLEI